MIILPTETVAREWNGRILLAVMLAQKNETTIIGNNRAIYRTLHNFPKNVFVSHTIVPSKRRLFRIIRTLGMKLAAWDEEGLVWASPEFYNWRRLDAENWKMLHRFFCWGEAQAGVIRDTFPNAAEKLRITGNPRQDFYTRRYQALHEETIRAIHTEYGDFILVNSNFGSLHSPRLPFTGIEKMHEHIWQLARVSGHKEEYIAFRQRVFLSLCNLVRRLSEVFPQKTILIRPHPSENPAAWRELAAPLPNVVVRYDHELIPWLLAADAVIHNGCTTAVETAMLGRPAIEYRAVELPEWESEVVSRASIAARSPEEAIALLRDKQTLQARMQGVEETLQHYIAHLNEGLACERIADELVELARAPAPEVPAFPRWRARWQSRLRAVEKRVVGRLNPHSSASPAYIDQKFPPMTTEQVRATTQRLCAMADLPVPRIEQLHDRIWRISPAQEVDTGAGGQA